MPKLSPLNSAQIIRKLRKLGFEGSIAGGRHSRMIHPERKLVIPIPIHGGKDVSVGLIRAIIRDVGITPQEWLEL
ncbi:MAG: type II toxin-antitoxin system HicA family toxin [Caldilineaceae bacterium]